MYKTFHITQKHIAMSERNKHATVSSAQRSVCTADILAQTLKN